MAKHYISEDGLRAIDVTPFCFACYEGKIENNTFKGKHVYSVGSVEDADLFLEGKEPKGEKLILYPQV